MDSKISLSYCWADKDIANKIDQDWKALGIILTRDIRDVDYKGSFRAFMQSMREGDFVLLIISENYLKSKNCMFEALELFQDPAFKDKILPVLAPNANIYNALGRLQYAKYWEEQISELTAQIKQLDGLDNITSAYQELDHLRRIRGSIDQFCATLSDLKYSTWIEVEAKGYKDIFEYIGGDIDSALTAECSDILMINDIQEQAIHLEQLSRKNPNNKTILFTEAAVAFKRKNYKIARNKLESIVSIYDDNTARIELGIILAGFLGKPQLAREQYESALEKDPKNSNILNNLALVLSDDSINEVELSKSCFEQAIEINPNDDEILINYANFLYQKTNDLENAALKFKTAFSINNANAGTHYSYGLLSLKQGNIELARHHLEDSIKLDPKTPAWGIIGNIILIHYKNLELADKYFKGAISLADNEPQGHYNYANYLAQHTTNHELALIHYRRAIDLDPNNGIYHINLCIKLLRINRMAEAREHYQRACAIDPSLKQLALDEALLKT
ncbi:tetratricopeptide repeat protein [Hymenobacter sp. BT18]|uniref:toll/interleukin-1 receptor domain-containing protein n=1 Tax=Hymenobacter sp. BT18 TaxID=2835648 RepID=UPI00143E3F1F|nr:toll/interleukin-1 receptor domain-containing protein [Hymenobacter sp. BT18]QIX59922.1 tetratricopeptide repeat protein [Hymenobacter sp. BT18]